MKYVTPGACTQREEEGLLAVNCRQLVEPEFKRVVSGRVDHACRDRDTSSISLVIFHEHRLLDMTFAEGYAVLKLGLAYLSAVWYIFILSLGLIGCRTAYAVRLFALRNTLIVLVDGSGTGIVHRHLLRRSRRHLYQVYLYYGL